MRYACFLAVVFFWRKDSFFMSLFSHLFRLSSFFFYFLWLHDRQEYIFVAYTAFVSLELFACTGEVVHHSTVVWQFCADRVRDNVLSLLDGHEHGLSQHFEIFLTLIYFNCQTFEDSDQSACVLKHCSFPFQ